MGSVIVDTSVWVDFLNNVKSEKVERLYALMEKDYAIAITPTIIQEVLQGIKLQAQFERIRINLLSYIVIVEDSIESAIGAAELYRDLRQKGVTIRKSPDCLIAWYALKNNATLLQKDQDFEQIAKHYPLKLV